MELNLIDAIDTKLKMKDYEVRSLFSTDEFKPVLDWLDTTDFYTAPASSVYHDNHQGGLVKHSLNVCYQMCKLKDGFGITIDNDKLLFIGLFHDLCKIGMYEVYYKNVKDEVTQKWSKVPAYRIRSEYTSIGHGIESVARLLKLGVNYTTYENELEAIKFHLGLFDLSDYEKYSYSKKCKENPLILWTHTSDMLASLMD